MRDKTTLGDLRVVTARIADGRSATVVDLLDALRDLEAETTIWCEKHKSANPYRLSKVCESFLRGIHMGVDAPKDLTVSCRLVERVLLPLTAEEV